MKSAASVSNLTFSGVYFIGALENDVSGSCGEPDCIDSFYGSVASNGQGAGTEHLRDTGFNYPVYDFTSDLIYNLPANGLLVGTNSEGLLQVGTENFYTLVVNFQAKTYSGTGVFVNPDGIVNAASFAPITNSVAPGEYVTVFGSDLGANALAPSLPLPATLGTAQATVSGTTAPLLAVSPTLMSIFVPSERRRTATSPYSKPVRIASSPIKSPYTPPRRRRACSLQRRPASDGRCVPCQLFLRDLSLKQSILKIGHFMESRNLPWAQGVGRSNRPAPTKPCIYNMLGATRERLFGSAHTSQMQWTVNPPLKTRTSTPGGH